MSGGNWRSPSDVSHLPYCSSTYHDFSQSPTKCIASHAARSTCGTLYGRAAQSLRDRQSRDSKGYRLYQHRRGERGSRTTLRVETYCPQASVTIEGIKFVVDCGFVKIRTYNPTTTLASLATVPTSVASATQRAGRAGRTSPGICYRLYPLSAFNALSPTTPPEITRTDMTTPILQLKSLGIDDLMKFEWVTSPAAETVLRALEGLSNAGMIGEDGRLTEVGKQVAECPVEVVVARMVRLLPLPFQL